MASQNSRSKGIHELYNTYLTFEMIQRIRLWRDLYIGNAQWNYDANGEYSGSLNLPSFIATEIARQVTVESKITVAGESERAKYLNQQIQPVIMDLRRVTEYACAIGGICFKPYVVSDDTGIYIDYIQADNFFPTMFDSNGNTIAGYFAFTVTKIEYGIENTYARIEYHEPKIYSTDGSASTRGYRITNTAYKLDGNGNVQGDPINLTEIEEWAEIEPEINFPQLDYPIFSYFRIPIGNTIDMKSPIGVSVYSRAIHLISDADRIYQGLLWEMKSKETAIDVSEDIFPLGKDGLPIVPAGTERIWRMNVIDPVKNGESIFEVFSPDIRNESYADVLNQLYERIEDVCGLARGTISNVEVSARTATEVVNLRQRSYATVATIQTALENALEGLIRSMNFLADFYELSPQGDYTTSYNWDDSIISDTESERARDMAEVAAGLMLPYEYRVKWYGEDEEEAKRKLLENKSPSDDILYGFNNYEVV